MFLGEAVINRVFRRGFHYVLRTLQKDLRRKNDCYLRETTLCRKPDVGNQRSDVTDCAESDLVAYQRKHLEQGDAHSIFKNLKRLNKNSNFLKSLIKDGNSTETQSKKSTF